MTFCEVVQFFVLQFVNVLLTHYLVLHVSSGVAMQLKLQSCRVSPTLLNLEFFAKIPQDFSVGFFYGCFGVNVHLSHCAPFI